MKKRILLVLMVLLLVNCTLFTSPATPEPPGIPTDTSLAVLTSVPPTAAEAPVSPSATPQEAAPVEPTRVVDVPATPSLQVDTSQSFTTVELANWQPAKYSPTSDQLPVKMNQVINPEVSAGLTEGQHAFLVENGFVVMNAGDLQFKDIRFDVADRQGQPYFLTTDAAYHGLHITFDELLKGLERENLNPLMTDLTHTLLKEVQSYQQELKGSSIEQDAGQAAAYLAVALKLLDPQVELPPDLENRITPQLKQIEDAAGRDHSVLFPDFEDDYGAYKPVGHYAGNPALENYFKGMTWYGRVSFSFKNKEGDTAPISRLPLIVTLALREAEKDTDQSAASQWSGLHKVLTYLIGPSDDSGPLELSALMDQVYGASVSVQDLADDAQWQSFLAQVDSLPAPQINSTFVNSTTELNATRDWRLMGQRFTLDGSILQNMVYDKVGSADHKRFFSSGLDVMAVFGSEAAYKAQETAGETSYLNYTQQITKLQQAVKAQPETEWLNRFYSSWLYAFIPQVKTKDEAYPPFMQTTAWGYKDLNSALGSWAELKHDTVLYTKMPEFMGGGGPPSSGPAPAYVEPNPDVFYRLSYLTDSISWATTYAVSLHPPAEQADSQGADISVERLMYSMSLMSEQFKKFGDIAVKELAGQQLDEEDFGSIASCIGYLECLPDYEHNKPPEQMPVIAAVAGAENEILEAGVGHLDRIYVAVPINGQLQIAQGGVFSYYEFTQPRDQRLTDEEWRARLASGPQPRPQYTSQFLLPGGKTNFSMAFRIGDIYIITEEGGTPPLNLRAQPSKDAAVVKKLVYYDYIEIIAGPVKENGNTWWQIQIPYTEGTSGWVLENPAWYERAYGQ